MTDQELVAERRARAAAEQRAMRAENVVALFAKGVIAELMLESHRLLAEERNGTERQLEVGAHLAALESAIEALRA